MKKVFYTINIGDYDNTLPSSVYLFLKNQGWKIIIFTDNINLKSDDTREVVNVNINYNDPRRTYQDYKIRPHLYLPNYDISWFLNCNIAPTFEMLNSYEKEITKGHNFICISHPDRNCVYDEGAPVILCDIDNIRTVNLQLDRYRKQGFPEKYGLIASGSLLRLHNHSNVISFGEYWFQETMLSCRRDQISFPYTIWNMKQHCVPTPSFINLPASILFYYNHPSHKRSHKVMNSRSESRGFLNLIRAIWGDINLTNEFKIILSNIIGNQLFISKSVPLKHLPIIGYQFDNIPKYNNLPELHIEFSNLSTYIPIVEKNELLYLQNDINVYV
jgi:hypothetical protein